MSQEQNEFLNLSNYKKDTKIGQGSFGKVFKVIEISTGEVYAAKISIIEIDEDQKSLNLNLMREVNIISQLNHPSILKFIGYSPIDFNNMPKPVIITEYSPNGSLESIIDLERKSLSPQSWNETKKLINIYGISSAMKYLHSHNIIHRDLKTANILEDDNLFPKIADFGLSKKFHQNQSSMSLQSTSGTKGTPIYMAPEIWETNEYTKAGDVYSFSYIIYEILTLERPFNEFTFSQFYKKVIQEGYRPDFKYPIQTCYQNLIIRCWSINPNERPNFEYIVDQLKNNEEFITNGIDRDEYYDYIDMIDNYSISFEPNKKFKKITVSKEKIKEQIMPKIFNQINGLKEFNDFSEEIKTVFKESLMNNNQNEDSKSITFQFKNVVLLYNKNLLNSNEFVKTIQLFDNVIFELNYPDQNFDPIFNILLYLATRVLKTIKFHYFISDLTNIYKLIGTKDIPISFDVQFMFASTEQKASFSTFPLLSITLNSSITSIKNFAFNGCTSLTHIELPTTTTSIGIHAFNGCISLKNINIPTSVKLIEFGAFYGCSSLEQITIPSSVTMIKSNAFNGCSSLKEITIPSSIEIIEENLFCKCSSLKTILIPSSVKTIGNWSFSQCFSLIQITIPTSVNSIGQSAFFECKSLEQIIIPSSVNSIGKGAFHKCISLKQISIPPSITIIDECLFRECKSLVNIEIPSSVISIGESAFDECFSLEKLIIPSSVKIINNCSFRNCTSLLKILIPSFVNSIGKLAFNNCLKLNEVVFENNSSLISLGEEAFSSCISLVKIDIPPSVKEIGKELFKSCNSLKELSVPSIINNFLFLSPKFVKNFIIAKYLGVDLKVKIKII